MGVGIHEIEVGKCYVTSTGQVRRVLTIEGDQVTYEARGKRALPKGTMWNPKVSVGIENFAAAVERGVPCDYDPDYSAA